MSEKSTSISELQESTSIFELQNSEISSEKKSFFEEKNFKFINDDTSSNIVIKKPPTDEILRKKIRPLIIDSRDRNYNLYPSASKFTIKFKEEYNYVKSLNLVMAQIPMSQYLINKNNNILHYYINSENNIKEIQIKKGNYPDPSPVNSYLPTPKVEKNESIILSNLNKVIIYNDYLSTIIQNEFIKSLKKNCKINSNLPLIEVGYDYILDSYYFNYDFCPQNDELYKGEKINLCFKGENIPYGNQEVEKVPKINIYDRIERNEKGEIVYEEKTIGEKITQYKKNTIGKLLGFGINDYNGYITNNINNTCNPLIFTSDSKESFTENLIINQYILLEQEKENGKCVQRFKIEEIIDDSTFKVFDPNTTENGPNAPLTPPGNTDIEGGIQIFSNASLYSGIIKAPFRKNFTNSNYIIMKIKKATKMDSENSNSFKSFAIIPRDKIVKYEDYSDYSGSLWAKSFNPPDPSLSELTFSFHNYDGSLYDFENYEITLQFMIEIFNQSIKYAN
jgi:hypothetical protein